MSKVLERRWHNVFFVIAPPPPLAPIPSPSPSLLLPGLPFPPSLRPCRGGEGARALGEGADGDRPRAERVFPGHSWHSAANVYTAWHLGPAARASFGGGRATRTLFSFLFATGGGMSRATDCRWRSVSADWFVFLL